MSDMQLARHHVTYAVDAASEAHAASLGPQRHQWVHAATEAELALLHLSRLLEARCTLLRSSLPEMEHDDFWI